MRYFIREFTWSEKEKQTHYKFAHEGIWEIGSQENKEYANLFSKISVGDMCAWRSTYPDYPKNYLRIKKVGIVSQLNSKSSLSINWTKNFEEFDLSSTDINKWYAKTLEEIVDDNDIRRIFGHAKNELQMKHYIDLLKSNKNLILTGAPGTGKTYLAREIAKEMGAETEFVQFHPSYDYTDFVEGLRPVKKEGDELGFELKDGTFKRFCKKALHSEKKFVIIIDEINRAEISKVFGELFFSIDPGYRGTKGKVKTQYANLQDDDDDFADGFYVPENVYIIGTMNDIDRSVESMDFAMRRRFAWQKIKSEDRISMWDGEIDDWKDDAKKRMTSLNKAMEGNEIQGLSSDHHIGPAYFLKLKEYAGDFGKLWKNHLEGVIFEYLRGLPAVDELKKKLENAYNLNEEENNG